MPLIVGTAGHIDHGKTSLVRALTGVDLDQLPEEKDRGITIALGFTDHQLPSGKHLAFVDVPGHERLIRTMIAGATGFDAVLLCISAVEGVMPQTREHLAILELLGVSTGVVALTMCDLVDDEMLELAQLDVEEAVQDTFLASAPVVLTSAGPSPQGLDALRGVLDALPEAVHGADGPFRLPVDRCFVKRGFGAVVTGTVQSGFIEDGAEVEVLPEGLQARVRGIEVHGESVAQSRAGARTALNLSGVQQAALHRGQVVTLGHLPTTQIIDVEAQILPGAGDVADGARVRVLLGTTEGLGVIGVFDGDALTEGRHLMQLRLEQPVVALAGDRFILRRESPMVTLGGGRILDPFARRVRKRHYVGAQRSVAALAQGDSLELLRRRGAAGCGPRQAQLLGVQTQGVGLADHRFHPDQVRDWSQAVSDALQRWHETHPLRAGAPRRDMAQAVPHVGSKVFDALLGWMEEQQQVVLQGPSVRLKGFEVLPTDQQRQALAELEEQVLEQGLQGWAANEVGDQELLHYLLQEARLVRVGGQVLHVSHTTELEGAVKAFLSENHQMGAGDFKSISGLTRKHAIPLLEWLDAQGITRRQRDVRVLA